MSTFATSMKNGVLFLAIIISLVVGCKPSVQDGEVGTDLIDPENPPVMTFEDTVFNFGTISQGESPVYKYNFTNTGGSNLIISDVRPSCGCTVPQSWPRYPIKPGKGGSIEVVFNSEGKSGEVQRYIRVTTNGKPSRKVLVIKGKVNAPGTE